MNTSQNQIMEFLAKIDDEINELQQKFVKAMTCENGDNRQLSIIDNTQFIEKEDRKHRIINIQRIQKSIEEIIQSNQSNEQMNAQSNEQEIEPKNELIIESHNKLKSLPSNISQLTNLQELRLHNNLLESLPLGINKFEYLRNPIGI